MKKLLRSLTPALPFAALVLLCLQNAQAFSAAREGLTLCTERIIPSLFPFLIFSSLLSGSAFPRELSRLCRKLFGQRFPGGAAGSFPFLIGLTGGYPAGAAAAADLYDNHQLTGEELAHTLTFCQNTGPALLLSCSAAGLLSETQAVAIWLCHLTGSILTGRIFRKKGAKTGNPAFLAGNTSDFSLTDAMKHAVSVMSFVCGYVVLFFVLQSLLHLSFFSSRLSELLPVFPESSLRCFFAGLMELSSGLFSLPIREDAVGVGMLAAFLISWGGVCVHAQTVSLLGSRPYSLSRYLLAKFLHGLLSCLLYGILCLLRSFFCHHFPFLALAQQIKY